MINFINKALNFLFAFALIASIAATTCNNAFIYDESDIIAPLWHEQEEELEPSDRR